MLPPDHLEEGLLVVNSGDHRFVRPDFPSAHRRSFPQPNAHCPPIVNNDLINGTCGAHHCPVGYGAAMDGVEIAVQATPGNAHLARVGCKEELDA
ncbi:unnamed protein product, partial [marine sediment metagenome]